MSCVYEIMSDCGRASADSMAKAQKSRELYNTLLRNRTAPTKFVIEKRRSIVPKNPKPSRPSSAEKKLSTVLDSKAKQMIPMTHTNFNNQTPVPIPGQHACVSCRTGEVPRLVIRRTYPLDALREQQKLESLKIEQSYHSHSNTQQDIFSGTAGDDMDSLDKLNFQEGWKSEKDQSVSSGPSFVQVPLFLL